VTVAVRPQAASSAAAIISRIWFFKDIAFLYYNIYW
jgi:hypothetical protein